MPAASPKTNGQRLVVLKLSPARLRSFPSDSTPAASAADADDSKESKPKVDASSPPSSSSGEALPPASSVDNASDAPSTPANAEGKRRKSMPGSRGTKRGLNQTGDLTTKLARSKPGPKKKQKLDDGSLDSSKLGTAAHKLGPKANQGAINAGLRALDRSGAPCRKWERKPLQLKSFTGILWDLPSWRSPKPPPKSPEETNGEAVVTVNGVAINGDSDSKANQASSAVPSEKSNVGEGDLTPLATSAAQSPTPAIAMTA